MTKIRESRVMRELEEMRAEYAKKLVGLSIEEKLRIYNADAEQARKDLGLNLPQAQKVAGNR